MKKTNTLRSVLFLLLVFSMLFGMIGTALAVEPDDQETINYVSLGDSMTNGYGLPGYDAEAGVYDYGYDSYANEFAELLAKENGWDGDPDTLSDYVDHAQLAMSAMRPEDLNFLLRLDYDDPEVSALLDKYPIDDNVFYRCSDHNGKGIYTGDERIVYCHGCKWNHVYDTQVDDYPAWWTLVHGENWDELIGYGDYWTWKELTEDYRFGTAATYIKLNYGTDAEKARAKELIASNPAKPRDDGSNGEETCYVAKHYQEQVAEADVISLALGNGNFGVWLMGRITDAIMKTDGIGRNGVYEVENLLKQLTPELQAKANEILADLDPYIEQYVNTMMGALDEAKRESIKEVCTYAVVSFLINYQSTIERILELNPDVEIVLLGLMNTYAGDAEQAEEGTVTIGSILDVLFPPLNMFIAGLPTYFQSVEGNDLYKDAKFYYAEEYTIECLIHTFGDEDFYNWNGVSRDRFVTGLVGDNGDGLFWSLLKGQNIGGVNIITVSKQDIADYYLMDNDARAAYAIQNKDKAASIAIYLAIEDAVCKSGRLAPVTLSTLTGLSLDASLLGTALENFNAMLAQDISAYYETATKALDAAGVENPTQSNINDISMVLAVPTTLSNALWTDPDLCSMLAVVARNQIGNGLGAHPSVAGHAALAEEMIAAYSTPHTADRETFDNLVELVKEHYAVLYPYAFDMMVQKGHIGDLLNLIDEAIAAAKTGEAHVADLDVPEELAKTQDLLLKEFDLAIGDLEELKAIIENGGKDADAEYAALLAMEEDLWEHYDNIVALADELDIVITPYIEDLYDAAVYYAGVVKDIAEETYTLLTETVKDIDAAYTAWVEDMGALADEIDPALGEAVRKFLTETPADTAAILYAYGDAAAAKLFADAVEAYGEIYPVIANLAGVLYEHGETIYNAVKDNEEVNALIEEIKAQLVKAEALAKELEEYINMYPIASAVAAEKADKEAALKDAYAELVYLYGRLCEVTFSVLEDVEPTAALALDESLDALVEVLGITYDAAEGYLGWLSGHSEAMGGALLTALLENIDELTAVACPIIDELIWNVLVKLPGWIHDEGYEFLYNNPDKVIAFFREYGDDMVDFVVEHWEDFATVIGWLAINYGDDVVDYVLENPETVLKVLVDYFNEHGEHGWALIDVYLKELGVYEQIDEALAQLAELLKNAGVDIVEELETLAKALIEKAEAALEELKEELAELKAQLENASGELAEEIKAKIAEIEAAIEALEQKLEELKAAVEKAIEEGIAAAAEELMAAVEEIKALLEELYIDATTDEYAVKSDSWYTAIGDGTAASESYVDHLAEDLNLGERYTNLAEAGQTILDAYDVITANKDTIAKSDLITVGYGVNGFNTFVKNQILSGDTMDWSTITGEESVEYIDAALAELKAYFVEQGLDQDIQIPMIGTKNLADTLTLAVEAYAYAYIEYVTNYPEVINAIHELSPEALVIIVGMYNPLEGVVIEGIDLGEYLGYIVDATNAHSLAYAMLTENVIYVDAPAVETKKTASEMTAEALILEMMTGFKNLVPSENGHEYIKTQLLNALEITGLLGDANGDGKVNNVDAMLVLQYYAGLGVEINTAVCDVDGNGKINNVDAMLILQYYAQIITVFPVEA